MTGTLIEAGAIATIVGGVLVLIGKYAFVTKADCASTQVHECERMARIERRLEHDGTTLLTEKSHTLICDAKTARIEKHISHEIDVLRSETRELFGNVINEIKRHDKGEKK